MPPNPAFDALFAQSRDLLCEGFSASLATIMAGADTSITEALDKATDQELKKIMMEARDLARTQRPTIEKQFREKYTTEVRKATNKAKKIAASLADISLGELSLVDDDDLNETLKYNAVAAKIKRKCEEELSAIDQRVRVLLDDPNLESDDNPFRAEIICDAFKHACRQAGGSVQARLVLLRLFEDGMPEAAAESYQKVNDLLVANQILPKIKYGITKSKSDPSKRAAAAEKAGGGGEKEKAGAAAPAEEPEDEGDMFARIQKMLAPIAGQGPPPAPGMGIGGMPIMQGADLSGALTKIQTGDFSGVTGPEGVDLSAIFAAAASMTNVLKDLKTSSEISLNEMPGLGYSVIQFNTAKEPFNNAALRRAISFGIDRDQIRKTVFFEAGRTLDTALPESLSPWYQKEPSYHPYLHQDAGAVKRELASAGKANGFKFTLQITAGSQTVEQTATLFQDQLKSLGIDVEIVKVDFATLLANARPGGDGKPASFEALIVSFTPSSTDPDRYLTPQLYTKAGQNLSAFSDRDLDKAIDDGRSLLDPAKAKSAYDKAVKIVNDQQPIVVYHNLPQITSVRSNVRNFPQTYNSYWGSGDFYKIWKTQ